MRDMIETEHLKLKVLTEEEESTTLARDFLRAMGSSGTNSNMSIIDRSIGELQSRFGGNVIWSSDQPDGQQAGDVWNQIVEGGGV